MQILKAMWTQDETTFHGEHYQLEGAINRPRPVQEPHPPLWIAGGGERLTLRVVAEHADYANYFGDDATFRRKTAVLQEHCRDVGRDFSEITLTANVDCLIGQTEAEAAEKLAEWKKPGKEAKEAWAARALFGTSEQVAAKVARFRNRGVRYLIVYFADAAWGDSMRRFATDVMPSFR